MVKSETLSRLEATHESTSPGVYIQSGGKRVRQNAIRRPDRLGRFASRRLTAQIVDEVIQQQREQPAGRDFLSSLLPITIFSDCLTGRRRGPFSSPSASVESSVRSLQPSPSRLLPYDCADDCPLYCRSSLQKAKISALKTRWTSEPAGAVSFSS